MVNNNAYLRSIRLWDLDKLRSGLAKMEDIYYNYNHIISLSLILKIKEEINERVGEYNETQELYGRNESRDF